MGVWLIKNANELERIVNCQHFSFFSPLCYDPVGWAGSPEETEVSSENPIISLVQGRPDWEYDDVFHFKCSMNGTRPASRLSWLLNGQPVPPFWTVALLFSIRNSISVQK